MSSLTYEDISRLLRYEPDTGKLFWRVNRGNKIREGAEAGCYSGSNGYVNVRINGRIYLAHRLAYVLMTGRWPDEALDHINGSRTDNRWENLRECSQLENARNRGRSRNNTSGYKGVSRHKCGKYIAQIGQGYERIYLGLFETAEEAHEAYSLASDKYHGEFGRSS